jgi:non-heme chloroperoxidase
MQPESLPSSRREFLSRTGKSATGLASGVLIGACGGGGDDANAANSSSAAKPLAFTDTAVTMVTGGSRNCAMRIAVREYGNPAGKPILFIPGFSQNHLCFYRQFTAATLAGFRLVVMDLRGHGDSDKTLPINFALGQGYLPDDYGDDVAAVMAAKGLVKPVIVGWSYGGFMIADYARLHGTGNIGGLNFVSAGCRYEATTGFESKHNGPGFLDNGTDLLTDDSAANTRGTINFLNACVKKPISQDDFATLLATNMIVTPQVRLALVLRPDFKYDLSVFAPMIGSLNPRIPTLVSQGAAETVVLPAAAQAIAASIPGSVLSMYDGSGHVLFIEDTARFNQELAQLRNSI